MTTSRSNDELFEYLRRIKLETESDPLEGGTGVLNTIRNPRSAIIITATPSVIPLSGDYECSAGNLATSASTATWALNGTVQTNTDRGMITKLSEEDIDLSYLGDGFYSYAKLEVRDYSVESETTESRWGPRYDARIDNLCFSHNIVPRYRVYSGYTLDIPLPRAHGGYDPYTYKVANNGQTAATTDGQLVVTETEINFRVTTTGKGSSSGTDTLYDYVVTDSSGGTATLTFQVTYYSISILDSNDEVSVSYLLPFRLKPQTYYGVEAVFRVAEPNHLSTRADSVKLHSWEDDDTALEVTADPPMDDRWTRISLSRIITSSFTAGDVTYVSLTISLKPGYHTTVYVDRIYVEGLTSTEELTTPTERPIVGSGITSA